MIQYISATQIHDGNKFLPSGTIIGYDEKGRIQGIYSNEKELNGSPVKHLEGIVCPGFVNAHCHLELSHLKGKVPEATGLVPFILNIPKFRFDTNEETIRAYLILAAEELVENGTVAVGDIANTNHATALFPHLPFHLQTFVESMGVVPAAASKRLDQSKQLATTYSSLNHEEAFMARATIVPHAPYSVSQQLLEGIRMESEQATIISVHHQESAAELQFFKDHTGEMLNLYKALGVAVEELDLPIGSSSSYVVGQDKAIKWLLVHNTFTYEEDIDYLKTKQLNVVFCLCPNANWYIERRLPNIPLLQASGYPICLGTDSLASNYSLNIWSEVQRIQEHYPDISLEELLQWATRNGADALGFSERIGTIEKGKLPGINHINLENQVVKII